MTTIWLVRQFEGGGGDAAYIVGAFTDQDHAHHIAAMQKYRTIDEITMDEIQECGLWYADGEPKPGYH